MTPELWAIAIQTAGLIVTLIAMHNQNVRRMSDIQTKVGLMWLAFEQRFNSGLPNRDRVE